MVASRIGKRGEVLKDRGRVFGTRMRLSLGVNRQGVVLDKVWSS
jgi:hypothetical protein